MTDKIYDLEVITPDQIVEQLSLPLWKRIYEKESLRRLLILVTLLIIWQSYSTWLNNSLLFPSASETMAALFEGLRSGILVDRILTSLGVLLLGYAVGIFIAIIMAVIAMT